MTAHGASRRERRGAPAAADRRTSRRSATASSASIRSSPRRRPATRSPTSRSSTATCCAASGRPRCSRATSRRARPARCGRSASTARAARAGCSCTTRRSASRRSSAFLLSRPEPIVLVYHNITPAKYFEGIDDTFAELLVLGRYELEVDPAPRRARDRRLAVQRGRARGDRLRRRARDPAGGRPVPPRAHACPTRRRSSTSIATFDGPMLLFVGQLLPHKRPDLLVKAMHVAATYLGVEARLLLVGQNRFARYADAVSARDPRAQPRRTCTWSARSTTRASRRCSGARPRS